MEHQALGAESFGTGEEVLEQYANMVYRLALSQVKSRHDADDIFQEVFLRYYRKNRTFESEEHRKAWLLRVTVNCSKRFWTSAWKRRTVPLEEPPPEAAQEDTGLRQALGELPQSYRAVLHLHYYEGYTAEQIGEMLHRKPSTVRMQLTRGRALLKEKLKGDD